MAKRVHYGSGEDAWIDVSSTVYEMAIGRAAAEDLTVQEALYDVLTDPIERVE